MPASIAASDLMFGWPDGSAVFDGLSFAFGPGRTGLIGANGSGKSTLLRLMTGDLRPARGSMEVSGSLGYLPQNLTLRAALRVDEALGIAGQRRALHALEGGDASAATFAAIGDDWDVIERAEATLARLGLGHLGLDRSVGDISGGEAVLLGLAAQFLRRPAVLLLDEPLANLDPVARTEVTGELMAEAADSDMTVMLSTHIIAELSGVGDHLLLLDSGRPLLAGDVDELLGDHVRLSGPRAAGPPGPGTVVQAQHTERQSTFVVRQPAGPAPHAVVAPGWTAQPLTLDELILTYLKEAA